MASWGVARSSFGKYVPKGMATQLAVMLSSPGKKQRKPWGELCNLTKEMRSLVLGYPDAEILLRQIMGLVVEKVSAERVDELNAIPLLKNLVVLVADQLNMIPLGNSVHVSWDTTFSEENGNPKIKNTVDLCAPYTVLSIVEAQSSGESYLPSHLFRTMFPATDPKSERMQTMKGISTSTRIDSSMLTLDIKGLDQRQRGQDTSFQNQAILLALTVSDIIMVTISIFDNGRQERGHELLFKTIFQERTKLPAGLTNMFIVFRDYDRQEPLEGIKNNFKKTLEQIWRCVNETKAFRDYIVLNFARLPDEKAQDFQKEVTTLKMDLSKITRSMTVPTSKFSDRAQRLWDQIKQNERFDLSSHMMYLATIQSQQIAEAHIGYYEDGVSKAKESILDFTEVARNIFDRSKTQYNKGDKEHQNMVNKDLIKKIQDKKSKQFNKGFGQLTYENVRTHMTTKEGDGVLLNYYDKAVEPYIMIFTNLCEDLTIIDPDCFKNNCGVLRKELTLYIALHILSLKEEDARNALEAEQIRCAKNIDELTEKLDQRKRDQSLRDLEIQQEITRAKDELELEALEHDKTKKAKAELERKVQWLERNKGMCEKEVRNWREYLEPVIRKLEQKEPERKDNTSLSLFGSLNQKFRGMTNTEGENPM